MIDVLKISYRHRRMIEDMFEALLSRWAILCVCCLIVFLSYSSQWLFLYLDPSPLDRQQLLRFNCLVLCIWICYARACWTDPGQVPEEWKPGWSEDTHLGKDNSSYRYRWCRKCEALKPPRAHHCRVCKKYPLARPYRSLKYKY